MEWNSLDYQTNSFTSFSSSPSIDISAALIDNLSSPMTSQDCNSAYVGGFSSLPSNPRAQSWTGSDGLGIPMTSQDPNSNGSTSPVLYNGPSSTSYCNSASIGGFSSLPSSPRAQPWTGSDGLSSLMTFEDPNSNGLNSQVLYNGPSFTRVQPRTGSGNYQAGVHNGLSYLEATGNVIGTTEGEPNREVEWVGQFVPGVYVTLTPLPGGFSDLKRVRFSRNRFSEQLAEQWWAQNRVRVYRRYKVRMVN